MWSGIVRKKAERLVITGYRGTMAALIEERTRTMGKVLLGFWTVNMGIFYGEEVGNRNCLDKRD